MSATQSLIRGWEVVIGMETHVQLSTLSKIFSGASTRFGAEPNKQACAVDLALPGTLPVLNRGAVERAIEFGLAVDAQIAPMSIFARKNYFYPDLPKGYQISQYEIPVVQGGVISFLWQGRPHKVQLTRAHLEEDAGKSLHEDYAGHTGIDLNRAGTPLLEIVTEPDMRSSAEAAEYARALHALVVWLGLCDGNMQEGSFRCDANVSVRRPGQAFGTRREIKNLNSFRFLQQAIDYEVQWQIDLIEDGGQVEQATVLFNPDTGETRAMRSKEDAHDYRYFPDPDLPPLVISPQWVEQVRGQLPELPGAMAQRLQAQHGLSDADAALLTAQRSTARYFETAVASGGPAKLICNWMNGELARRLNANELDISISPVPATVLAGIVQRVQDATVSGHGAKQLMDHFWHHPAAQDATEEDENTSTVGPSAAAALRQIDQIIADLGLRQVNDSGLLESIVEDALSRNPKLVEEYKSGKDKAFNALVGQCMKASQGKANPQQIGELLKAKLQG